MCGGRVVQRDDDTEEAVQRRLEIYEHRDACRSSTSTTGSASSSYIDAVGEGDEVFERLVKEIDQRFDPATR